MSFITLIKDAIYSVVETTPNSENEAVREAKK